MNVLKLTAICLVVLTCQAVPSLAVVPHPKQESLIGQTAQSPNPDESTEVTGVLTSRNPTSLKNKTGHDAAIVDIVPDGSWVSKGDVVIQLDDSFLEQRLEEQKIQVQAVQSKIERSERQHATSASELKAAVRIAKKRKEVAELDHIRFFGENGKHERAISRQQQLLDLTVERKRLIEQQLERIDKDAHNILDTKELELKIDSLEKEIQYREVEIQSLRGPESEYHKSALELATLEATNRLEVLNSNLETLDESAQSEIRNFQRTLEQEIVVLKTLDAQLAACVIRATRDGQIHYSTRRTDDFVIEPGETVRDYEEIAIIPDMKSLQVEVRLNEAQVAHAKIGQRATIKFRRHDNVFPGAVLKIDDFPEPHSWRNRERLYRVYISIDGLPEDIGLGEEASVILINQ